jgi:hypothetical protein
VLRLQLGQQRAASVDCGFVSISRKHNVVGCPVIGYDGRRWSLSKERVGEGIRLGEGRREVAEELARGCTTCNVQLFK